MPLVEWVRLCIPTSATLASPSAAMVMQIWYKRFIALQQETLKVRTYSQCRGERLKISWAPFY